MLSIEKSLLKFSEIVYQKVTQYMEEKYGAYLADCYHHPEYLQKTLTELYGKSYYDLVDSITNELREFSYQKPIERFLVSINPRFVQKSTK